MKNYEFQILQYRHDIVTKEFINVGIVMFIPEEKVVKAKVIDNVSRLSTFFHGIDSTYVRKIIHSIEKYLNIEGNSYLATLESATVSNLLDITYKVMPPNDAGLNFSESVFGITKDIERTFSELFARYVGKYEIHKEIKSRNDSDAWTEYKKYFESFKIAEKLTKPDIKVKTASDEFEFEHAWKNGRWNFYKPVSFDMTDEVKTKEKIYRFLGMTNELLTSQLSFNLNYLALSPKNDSFRSLLSKLDKSSNDNKICIKIIYENEAEIFARSVSEEITIHESEVGRTNDLLQDD